MAKTKKTIVKETKKIDLKEHTRKQSGQKAKKGTGDGGPKNKRKND